jgi:putative flippase GtrA
VLGAGVGWVTYEILFFLNPFTPRAASAWLAAFVISVPRQHALHRWLTFGERCPYWPSLFRAYAFYSALAAATTALDWWLVERLAWGHRLAWLVCIAATGVASYALLKRTVFIAEEPTGSGQGGARPRVS